MSALPKIDYLYLDGVKYEFGAEQPTKVSELENDSNFQTDTQVQASIEAYHDDTKQDVIENLDTIISNAEAGKNASDTIAGYGDVVSHDASDFATAAQGTKADNADAKLAGIGESETVKGLIDGVDGKADKAISDAGIAQNAAESAQGSANKALADAATAQAAADAAQGDVDELEGRVETIENAGYITKDVEELTNFYDKDEVNSLVQNFEGFEIVTELPTENIKTNVIYMVGPKASATGPDKYDEYVRSGNEWIMIGDTTVDLSNYYNKDQVDDLLDDKQDTIENLSTIISNAEAGKAASDTIATMGNIVFYDDTDFMKSELQAVVVNDVPAEPVAGKLYFIKHND